MIPYYGHAGITNNLCQGILKRVFADELKNNSGCGECSHQESIPMTLKVDGRLINRFQK